MKQWKTYGKKRASILPSSKQFNGEGEEVEVRPQKSRKLTPLTPLSGGRTAPMLGLLDTTPKPYDSVNELAEELLASSPARSDHSSSMKSVEPAMERRVSLLLRGETVHNLPPRSARPWSELIESSPDASPALPGSASPALRSETVARDTASPISRVQRRFSSFLGSGSSSPSIKTSKPVIATVSSSPPIEKRSVRFNKAMSTVMPRPHTPRSRSADVSSSKAQRSPSPFKVTVGVGRRMLERAKSAVARSPLKPGKKDKNKGKGRERIVEDDNLLAGEPAAASRESTVYSPSNLFFDVPELRGQAWTPTDRTRVPSRPITHDSMQSIRLNGASPSPRSPFLDRTALGLSPMDSVEKERFDGNTTPKFHMTPSGSMLGRNRLSMIEASARTPLDSVPRSSLESERSNALSSIASRAPEHELRRTTTRIKKSSLLATPSSDLLAIKTGCDAANAANQTTPARTIRYDTLDESPQTSPTLSQQSGRRPFAEKDGNQKSHREDDGAVKIAHAMRVSVSPKVREVFNKFPKRRTAAKPPRTKEPILSRSSSKASRILGHHVGSRELLRPPRGDQVTAQLLKESSSEDELAS